MPELRKFVLIAALALCPGCRGRGTSDAQHASSLPLPAGPFRVDVTREILEHRDALVAVLDEVPLPADHPLSQTVDSWVLLIDRAMRGAGLVSDDVPVPRGHVLPADDANAFNPLMRQCLDLRVEPLVNVSVHVPAGEELRAEIDVETVSAQFERVLSWRSLDCRSATPDELHAIRQVLARGSCRRELSGTTIRMAAECYAEDGPWRAETVSIFKNMNAVVVNRGLLARLPREDMLVSVIAHELAHYYRAHHASLLEAPRFWYRDGEWPVPEHRTPLAPDRVPADLVQALDTAMPFLPRIAGAELGAATWPAMLGFLDDRTAFCDQCPPSCEEASALLGRNRVLAKAMQRDWFPHAFRAPPGYLRFEASLRECLRSLPGDAASRLVRLTPVEPARIGHTENLWEALRRADALHEADRSVRLAQLERARALQLGLYTTEQEADEFGLEIATRFAGIDPVWVLREKLASGPWRSAEGYPDFQQCHRMARNGWKRPDGSWESLIPMNTNELHHDNCFRAYNVAREIAVHGGPNRTLPPERWKVLRELARRQE